MAKKPTTGYENNKKKKNDAPKKHGYISSLVVSPNKTVSIGEKVVKFLIYIALRIVIRPKKWRHPEKNYEIIDRTYKRIMSADFIFIPSSIAFYIVMAFMPIFTLIMFIYSIEPIRYSLGSKEIFDVTVSLSNGSLEKIQMIQESLGWTPTDLGDAFDFSVYGPKFADATIVDFTQVGWTSDPLKDTLDKFIPGMGSVLDQIALLGGADFAGAEVGSILLTLFSLITTTWIAAGGMAKLVFTQSHIFEHKYVGGYWMNKLKGMTIVLGLTVFLFVMFAVQIYINSLILQMDSTAAPKWAIQMTSYLFLGIASFAMVFVGFLLFFKLTPRFKIKFKHLVPGAMVATIPTAGFLVVFGFITSMWSYGAYGILGVMMYVGMTSLIISIFVFMGIITNAAYYKTFVSDHVNKKWTISKK